MEILAQIITLIRTTISFGTVIMYGSLGEIMTEKSGHLNLGVPGIMYMGGIGGLSAPSWAGPAAVLPSPCRCSG